MRSLSLYRRLFPCSCFCHRFSTSSVLSENQKYFLTTPIFYVNAAPHIGHLYTALLADASARWHRLLGYNVIFTTGTDEHGLKIQQAADKAKCSPNEFCSKVSASFKDLFHKSSISYTDYIRTTEERHRKAVQHFWTVLEKKGYIYKGSYSGWYSVSDEAFLSEMDTKVITSPSGETTRVSVDSEQPVTWMEEENYMFRLSECGPALTEWLDTGAVEPEMFQSEVHSWINDLRDLSVSRQIDRLSWGIPVPDCDTQTIYVWLDALVNYLTVGGYPNESHVWPADFHVVGKDILKFHAVYWPAFLMAAGYQPPKKILCHSHWKADGLKMSKSRGNVVDPLDRMQKYSCDGFRYFLLREGIPHSDGNYSDKRAVEVINSEIVNTMGNLLSRCTGKVINPEQIFPRKNQDLYIKRIPAHDRETFENLDLLADVVDQTFKEFNFHKGIGSIFSYLWWANRLVDEHKIWEVAKSSEEEDKVYLNTVLHLALDTLRVCGILLQPVIPNIAARLLDRLGIPEDKRTVEHSKKPYLNSPSCLPLGKIDGVLMKQIKL